MITFFGFQDSINSTTQLEEVVKNDEQVHVSVLFKLITRFNLSYFLALAADNIVCPISYSSFLNVASCTNLLLARDKLLLYIRRGG